jgi:hypothetical protein
MAELHVSTSHPSSSRRWGQGSPFATELDRRLAGDEPLTSIIRWWYTAYFAWRKTQPEPSASGEGPSLLDLTDNETTVLTLNIGWSFSLTDEEEELTKAIKSPGVCPALQSAWDDVREARAALRAAAAAGEQQQP